MSRPFPDTFEKEQSPMTPSSAASTNTPISYKTNVNRQKTKKWADAKPASYGGDDWGDDDDYDIPPPPIAKPTGFRQQGQAVYTGPSNDSPIVGTRKNYGELPPLPVAAESGSTRPRANSFDANDEQRNFSSGTVRQPSPAPTAAPSGPATRFSQITGQPSSRVSSGPPALSISTQIPAPQAVTGLRKASVVSPASGSPHPDVSVAAQVDSNVSSSFVSPISDSRAPSVDYQARQDYSPSAAPLPLHTRGPSAPQSAVDPPSTRFPARKSSLSQSTGPDVAEITRSPQETGGPKSWVAGRSSSPSAAPISPVAQGKALPFIRPADIYKRMEEEREKERQSLDSGRPSMDSIIGAKSSERSESPAARQLKERSSSDSLGTSGRRRTSFEGDDTSDSGRARPMLEPVRERKSEYSFEGFNVHEEKVPESVVSEHESAFTERDALEVEKVRRSSTSPKLPDLNRISGFGIDLFARPKSEEIELPAVQDKTNPIPSSDAAKPHTEQSSVREEPTSGFKSVVDQAFERREDSSVPDTPTSGTNNGIRRTDSDSTGTTGISPIMSRVPSSAAPDSRNRDAPSKLEVVNETTTGSSKAEEAPLEGEHSIPPSFNPGHRHDMSTPSRGSSPARTPDFANSTSIPSVQEVVVSDPSPASSIGGDDDQLQPPRPLAEREHSFRPNLPGGWTSYATSAQSETSHLDHAVPESSNLTQTTPTTSTPGFTNRDDSDFDITPTTASHPIPQSTLRAGDLDTNNKDAPVSKEEGRMNDIPRSETIHERQYNDSEETFATPDHSRIPGGNLDPTHSLDPQIHTEVEQAPPETQSRPDTVNRTISADSSQPPTPPDKDTPESAQGQSSGYFPQPPNSSTQNTIDEGETEDWRQQPTKFQVIPSLGTDAEPQNESDKLSNEIIQSLSPKTSNGAPRNDYLQADHSDDPSNPARISSYLPSEYDNYWATTAEESSAPTIIASPPQITDASIQQNAPLPTSSPREEEPDKTEIQPLYTNNAEQSLGASRSGMHSPRFSWQASSEDVTVLPGRTEPHISTNERPVVLEQPLAGSERSISDQNSVASQDPLRSHPASNETHLGRDAALLAGGTALGGAAALYSISSPQHEQSSRKLSLAEEKDPLVSSSYPLSPTPPEDQHPARVSETYLAPQQDHLSNPSAPSAPSVPSAPPSSVSPVTSPIQSQFPPQSTPNPRILAFKDIVAMKSPQQRIQTFDETRHRFATVDYGLANWMMAMKAQYAEHANATGSFSGIGVTNFPTGAAKGKFTKAPGGAPPSLQQPYYQQYLNASSPTTPGTPVSRPGPSTPVGSQQGLSPAGGTKITTQQVQAKGKEFFHTAGIFGGKAGKAGKGLLAKGKNKLRGAGGDKVATSPPTKNERRTSWGNTLTLSRSSGRPDGSSRNPKEEITPVPMQSREQAAALTLDTSQPPVQSQIATATNDSDIVKSAPGMLENPNVMSGALPTTDSPLNQNPNLHASYSTEQKHPSGEESADRDNLRAPAPIGKEQPSWDPFDATPITEEGSFQFEDRSKRVSRSLEGRDETNAVGPRAESAAQSEYPTPQSHPMQPASEEYTLSTLTGTRPAGVHSSSGVSRIQDDHEPPSDLNDWVIVPKEIEQHAKEESPDESSKPIPASLPAPNNLPPSLLDRTQGTSEPKNDIDTNSLSVINTPDGGRSSSILDRPRYSYEVPRDAPQNQTSPPQSQTKAIPQEHPPPRLITDLENVRARQLEEDPQTSNSFNGLPPIRRSSTFGLGFGSRQIKEQLPLDEEVGTPAAQQSGVPPQAIGTSIGSRASTSKDEDFTPSQQNPPQSQYFQPQSQVPPSINQNRASVQSQQTIAPQAQSQQLYSDLKANDVPPGAEGFRSSQDAWRPNVVTPSIQSTPHGSPAKWSMATVSPPRSSVEQQRNRAPSFTQRPDISYNERMGRPVLNQQAKPFETPPSSAQRYPDLFRQEQSGIEGLKDPGDLPAHYYQPPIPREAAFLPRQQTNEYQLPGVGPPSDEPRPASRRNSGILRDLGNKIRSVSRDRSNSISRDGGMQSPSKFDSQKREYAASSITSEDGQEQNKRRSSFFGMNRASTIGLGSPQSRESMVAHHPGSRTDLLLSTQPSPVTPQDKKRSFFGSHASEQKPKPNKLSRASTSGMIDEPGKKKRFSGLSSMFTRSSKDSPASTGSMMSDRPQATRELSHQERQPIDSPVPNQQQFPIQNSRAPTQQRNLLTKVATVPASSQPGQENKSRKSTPGSGFLTKISSGSNLPNQPPQDRSREDSKTRKNSSSGLLSGFMGRRPNQQEKREDSSSQGSQSQFRQNQVPPAQTYSDLQDQHTPTQASQPAPHSWQGRPEQNIQPSERGRRPSREPRYDTVPIPGGYSLVRGQGAIPVATDYDPRGYNRSQQADPQDYQEARIPRNIPLLGGPIRLNTQQSTPSPRTTNNGRVPDTRIDNRPPNLESVESLEAHQHSRRRLSREDLLARSPARVPDGQQRPYQLSLPEDTEERQSHSTPYNQDVPIVSPPGSVRALSSIQTTPSKISQHNSIQRLNQPILRHPESPAGYPLPEDTVFSPVNPSANNLPPPPPPKWPQHLDNIDHHHLHLNPNLDRSNTHRTAISGISQISVPDRLAVHGALDKETGGREGITPSPTPPSPGITPPPHHSPGLPRYEQRGREGENIQTTTLNREPSPDLYNASPRLPKPASDLENDRSMGHGNGHSRGDSGGGSLERPRVQTTMTNPPPPEEKIFYDKDRVEGDEEDEEPVPAAMSATSYPGQEWNPYAGVYEDDY